MALLCVCCLACFSCFHPPFLFAFRACQVRLGARAPPIHISSIDRLERMAAAAVAGVGGSWIEDSRSLVWWAWTPGAFASAAALAKPFHSNCSARLGECQRANQATNQALSCSVPDDETGWQARTHYSHSHASLA